MHTHNEIFPRIAMYRALKIELPDSAIEIMDAAVKKAGTKVGNTIGALTKIPGMPKVFVRIMGTQTLGTGGRCCDFHFKAERKK